MLESTAAQTEKAKEYLAWKHSEKKSHEIIYIFETKRIVIERMHWGKECIL